MIRNPLTVRPPCRTVAGHTLQSRFHRETGSSRNQNEPHPMGLAPTHQHVPARIGFQHVDKRTAFLDTEHNRDMESFHGRGSHLS